jgi:hypothetical protein
MWKPCSCACLDPAAGLHAYLTQFLDRAGDLGVGISRDFLGPMAA